MSVFSLYGRPGWGSAIVEAQLAYLALPFEFVEVGDLFQSPEARAALARINPVAQIPTLVLPDGTVMTESAAITLHLADLTGSSDLVPAAGEAVRAEFLRWLVFLVANLYPTFTYADDPERFVTDKTAAQTFRTSVDAYGEKLWQIVESAAGAPWFLGQRFSALDIYVAVMSRWRPRRAWFARHAPKLNAIAERCDAEPRLATVWRHNLPELDAS
jgi:GST-like protein